MSCGNTNGLDVLTVSYRMEEVRSYWSGRSGEAETPARAFEDAADHAGFEFGAKRPDCVREVSEKDDWKWQLNHRKKELRKEKKSERVS